MDLLIAPNGSVRALYADALAPIMESVGTVTVARASHVEPLSGGGWGADMAPVGGGVLGPFTLRAEALSAEVAWLQARGIPVPNERGSE